LDYSPARFFLLQRGEDYSLKGGGGGNYFYIGGAHLSLEKRGGEEGYLLGGKMQVPLNCPSSRRFCFLPRRKGEGKGSRPGGPNVFAGKVVLTIRRKMTFHPSLQVKKDKRKARGRGRSPPGETADIPGSFNRKKGEEEGNGLDHDAKKPRRICRGGSPYGKKKTSIRSHDGRGET